MTLAEWLVVTLIVCTTFTGIITLRLIWTVERTQRTIGNLRAEAAESQMQAKQLSHRLGQQEQIARLNNEVIEQMKESKRMFRASMEAERRFLETMNAEAYQQFKRMQATAVGGHSPGPDFIEVKKG